MEGGVITPFATQWLLEITMSYASTEKLSIASGNKGKYVR
ncbi:MAG: hypothetical protein HKUEN01_12260 [Candidatus Kuenenia stuttgartiensis]|nr:MAG: hypothetical protein HKUEN01_12260 [Candidatus Kuenenia stuttgartiensis]